MVLSGITVVWVSHDKCTQVHVPSSNAGECSILWLFLHACLSSTFVSTIAGRSLLMADLGVRTEFQHAAQDEGKNSVNTEHLLRWAAAACHPCGASQSWQGFMFSNVWWNKLHTKLQEIYWSPIPDNRKAGDCPLLLSITRIKPHPDMQLTTREDKMNTLRPQGIHVVYVRI